MRVFFSVFSKLFISENMRKKEGEEINKSLAQLSHLGFGPEIVRKLNTDVNVSLPFNLCFISHPILL